MRTSLFYRRNNKPVLQKLYNTKHYKAIKHKREKITNGINNKLGQPLTQGMIQLIEQGVVHDMTMINIECSQYYSSVTRSIAKVKTLQQLHRYDEKGVIRKVGISKRATSHVAPGASSDTNSTYWENLHIIGRELLFRSYKKPLINMPHVVLYDLFEVLCTIIADEFEQDEGDFDCIALVWMDEFYPTSLYFLYNYLFFT